MANDALCMSKLNVGPGGKQPCMCNTTIPYNNQFGCEGQLQFPNYPNALPDDHPLKKLEGQPKGMRTITKEQGYVNDSKGKLLVGDCA
jgi:hypothetical protein